MEISDLKSTAMHLTKYYIIQKFQRDLNEILWICVAYRAVKLPKLMFEKSKY